MKYLILRNVVSSWLQTPLEFLYYTYRLHYSTLQYITLQYCSNYSASKHVTRATYRLDANAMFQFQKLRKSQEINHKYCYKSSQPEMFSL